MSMRTIYLYLYIALAFIAGLFLVSPQAFAYKAAQNAPVAPAVQNSQLSQNWAGYVADSAQNYTAIGASWVVPTASASNDTGLSTDATWVGIGGVKSNDLIQAGTQAIIQNGQTSYEAWYEALPGYQTMIPLTINAGDSVTVSLAQTSSDNWNISFADHTTGKSYSTAVAYHSSLSSAEWIEEMPVMQSARGSMTYIPLDNFGTVNFSGAYTIANGEGESLSAAGAQPLTMASGRTALATPSVLADDGSFSVTRSDTQVAPSNSMQVATSYNPHTFRRHNFSRDGSQTQTQPQTQSQSQQTQTQTQTFTLPGGGVITLIFGMWR
jgi:hypothetical protein